MAFHVNVIIDYNFVNATLKNNMDYHRLCSKIAENFLANNIDQDLLTVPGISNANKERLNDKCGIECTDQLIGQFFWLKRDQGEFKKYLEDVGFQSHYAHECSEKMKMKFGGL